MQTKSVELTRNDMKLIKRALSMYKNKKASISTKEFNICNSLWKYIDKHQKEHTDHVESTKLDKFSADKWGTRPNTRHCR